MGYVFGLFIGKKNKPIPCCLYNNNCWVFVLSFSDVLSYSLYSRRLKLIKTSEKLSPNHSQSNENIYNMHKKRKNIAKWSKKRSEFYRLWLKQQSEKSMKIKKKLLSGLRCIFI